VGICVWAEFASNEIATSCDIYRSIFQLLSFNYFNIICRSFVEVAGANYCVTAADTRSITQNLIAKRK
jgi:hypothetical protein